MIIVRHSQHQIMPWKNGQGTTREIYRYPSTATGADFSWRLSLANVNGSGPFSPFAGVHRTIVQLSGPTMTLHHEEKGLSKKLELYQPYEFSGDWQTNCEVSGPSQDLNLMIQRSRWGAQSRTLELGASRTKQKQELPANATWLILFAISGRWHCESSRGEKPESLAAFDTALYHKAEKTLAGPPSPTLSQTPQDEFISVRCEEPGHLLVSILWLTGEHQP